MESNGGQGCQQGVVESGPRWLAARVRGVSVQGVRGVRGVRGLTSGATVTRSGMCCMSRA